MAFWNRQGRRVYVYTYDKVEKKQKAVSRGLVKHLDGEPDHNVQAWVDQYELQYEGKKLSPHQVPENKKLTDLVERFCEFLKSRKRAKETVDHHRSKLLKDIIPYFLSLDPTVYNDPNNWPSKSIQLLEYLKEKGVSEFQILAANTSLRSFWNWLADERYIVTPYELRLRNPVVSDRTTPLKRVLTPDEVLAFSKSCPETDLKLMALLGYFFSLRPFEIFALKKSDFRAGSKAAELECCTVMAKYDLYSKLAVYITKQRRKQGQNHTPKAHSKGWVSCFNQEAAKLVVEILNTFEADDPLFKSQNDWNIKKWSRSGIENINLKDLRRSSLYQLGHHEGLDLIPLMNHARHKKAETTRLYLRRPEDQVMEFEKLDLDA